MPAISAPGSEAFASTGLYLSFLYMIAGVMISGIAQIVIFLSRNSIPEPLPKQDFLDWFALFVVSAVLWPLTTIVLVSVVIIGPKRLHRELDELDREIEDELRS